MAVAIFTLGSQLSIATPDIQDLFKKVSDYKKTNGDSAAGGKGSDIAAGIGGLVQAIAGGGQVSIKDLEGTWRYSKPAVSFKSDNLLQKAGGAAASAVIVNKIEPYFKRARIDQSEVTFAADSTFTFRLGKLNLKGTIAPSTEEGASKDQFVMSLTSKIGKKALGHVDAYIKKSGKNLEITFDVTKLMNLVSKVASATGQSTLKSVSSLLDSYKGLNLGSVMTPVGGE